MKSVWDERPDELTFLPRYTRLELLRIAMDGLKNQNRSPSELFWYLHAYSRALGDLGKIEEFGQTANELLEKTGPLDPECRLIALGNFAFYRLYIGDENSAITEINRAVDEAIILAKPATLVHLLIQRCYVHTVSGDLEKAISDGLKAIDVASSHAIKEFLPRAHQDLSIAFHAARMYQQSEQQCKIAIDWYIQFNYNTGGVISNLANAISSQSRYAEARTLYLEALEQVRKNNHTLFEMRVLSNLAYVHCLLKEYDKALEFGKEGFALCLKNNDIRSAGTALVWLAKAEYGLGNYESALDYVRQMDNFSLQEEHQKWNLLEFVPDSYAKLGRYQEAYLWQSNRLEYVKDLKARSIAASDIYRSRLEEETLQKSKEIIKLREEQLTNTTLQLLAQTELLSNFRNEIREIVRKMPSVDPLIKQLKEKLKELPCESINWDQYDTQFQAAHPDFAKKLVERYPELTATELRVCSLVRMNLRSDEIARLFCLSERTIESHRFWIRKKMGLAKGEDLAVALAKL